MALHFSGGLFRMRLALDAEYPSSPPKGTSAVQAALTIVTADMSKAVNHSPAVIGTYWASIGRQGRKLHSINHGAHSHLDLQLVLAGYFLTKIFHPNVSKSGEICVNVLKKDWKPDLGIRHVLLVIRCLLIEPFPESALNEEAGKLLLDNYEDYAKHARLMTSIHAPPKRWEFHLLLLGFRYRGWNMIQQQGLSPYLHEGSMKFCSYLWQAEFCIEGTSVAEASCRVILLETCIIWRNSTGWNLQENTAPNAVQALPIRKSPSPSPEETTLRIAAEEFFPAGKCHFQQKLELIRWTHRSMITHQTYQ